MNGGSLLLDTNIILYFLSGDDTLVPLLEEKNLIVSVITEIELLGYEALKGEELVQTKRFLSHCIGIGLTPDVKEKAIFMRRKYKMKLPDAIIMATAVSLDIPMITADEDFKKVKSKNLILYEK